MSRGSIENRRSNRIRFGSKAEKIALVGGTLVTLTACAAENGTATPTSKATETSTPTTSPTPTLRPTETATLFPTPSLTPSFTPRPTETLTPSPTLTETPIGGPARFQNEVVHSRELQPNNVFEFVEGSPEEQKTQWWKAEVSLVDQLAAQKYEGDSFLTSLTNSPAMDAQGKPDFPQNRFHTDPQQEHGLGQTSQDFARYFDTYEVLSSNMALSELSWDSENGQQANTGFYDELHNRDASTAILAAIEMYETTPEIDRGIHIVDLLKDPRYSAQIRALQLEILQDMQIRSKGVSTAEAQRREQNDRTDTSVLLSAKVGNDLYFYDDQFDSCNVVRPQAGDRVDQLQTLRVTQYDERGTELGQVHRTTDRYEIFAMSFVRGERGNFDVLPIDGGAAYDLYNRYYDRSDVATPTATLIPQELGAINEEQIACDVSAPVIVTPTATEFIPEFVPQEAQPTGQGGNNPTPEIFASPTYRPTNIPSETPVYEPTVPVFPTSEPTAVPTIPATEVPRPTEPAPQPTNTPMLGAIMGPEVVMVSLIAAQKVKERIRKFRKSFTSSTIRK